MYLEECDMRKQKGPKQKRALRPNFCVENLTEEKQSRKKGCRERKKELENEGISANKE